MTNQQNSIYSKAIAPVKTQIGIDFSSAEITFDGQQYTLTLTREMRKRSKFGAAFQYPPTYKIYTISLDSIPNGIQRLIDKRIKR